MEALAIREKQEVSIADMEKMAKFIVESKLFGISNVAQAVSLMLVAQSEGLHPAIAARDYHIIQGRPTMKADAMLARFQSSGGKVEWQAYSDDKVSALFSHPQSPKPILVEWDMKRAKQAELGGKDMWKKYPRQMLKARVVSDGIRLCAPGCCVGVYTPEEAADFEPIKNVTPIKPAKVEKAVEPETPVEEPIAHDNDNITEEQKKELKKVIKTLKNQTAVVSEMKSLFGVDSLCDLHKDTFEAAFEYLTEAAQEGR